ncbi:hypothetical protein D3C71_2234310 [compost metagenome]
MTTCAIQGRGNPLKNASWFPLTPFDENPIFSAALISPSALVPCLSVPAISRICAKGIFNP